LFPEGLFGDADPAVSSERAWWVLHTRPRQEKSLARELRERRLGFYLPLLPRRSQLRGRVLTSYVPLFAGYVFLLAEGEDRVAALATGRVVRALQVKDQGGLWRDLRQIHQLMSSGAAITPEDRLSPGMTVEIQSGPLSGLRGKILRSSSGRRFVVTVDFIQQGASVLLDDFNLVCVEGEPDCQPACGR